MFNFKNMMAVALLALLVVGCAKKLTIDELVSRANSSFDKGELQAAQVDVKLALQINRDDPHARRLFGEIYLRQHNASAAVDEFRRSLETNESTDTRVLLARALLLAGRAGELLDDWALDVYASAADSAEFQASLSRAYLAQGRFEESDSNLAAMQRDDIKVDAYVEVTRAMNALALSEQDEAIDILESVVARDSANAEAWSLLGRIAEQNQNYERAAMSFASAVEHDPYRFSDKVSLVEVRIKSGDFDAADMQLRSLETAFPGQSTIVMMRGMLQLERGDNESALASFNDVLSSNERDPRALYYAARLNLASANLESAHRQLKLLSNLFPDNQDVSLLLGRTLLMQGEYYSAEEIARKHMEDESVKLRALGLLAMSLSSQGMHAESASAYREVAALSPDSVEVASALGVEQIRQGNSEAGIAQLRNAVELNPQNERSWGLLIEALLSTGDLDAARDAAFGFREALPDVSASHVYAGRVLIYREEYDAATQSFNEALRLAPGQVAATMGLAAIATINFDVEKAEALLQDAFAENPGDLAVGMNLAVILQERSDFAEMEAVLSEVMTANPASAEPAIALARYSISQDRPGEAISILTSAVDSGSTDYRLHQILAGAYLLVDQLDAAANSAQRLIDMRGEDPQALITAARVEWANGRPEQAQKYAEAALSLAPDSVDLRRSLIEILTAQGKWNEAGREVAKLPDSVKSETALLSLQGRIALFNDDLIESERFFAEVFEREKSSASLAALARAQWLQGEHEAVILRLEDWLGSNPADDFIRYELASRLLQLGDDDAAQSQFEILIEREPENVVVLNNLAWLLRSSNTALALEYVERASESSPQNGQVLDTHAMVELENGNMDRALALNAKALETAPDSPDIRYNRAQILARAGQKEKAADLLRELVAGPAFAAQADAKALLGTL